MAIHADNAINSYSPMLMNCLIADDMTELFHMADPIWLARRYFQDGFFPISTCHPCIALMRCAKVQSPLIPTIL
jgi:hypothetical protein